MSALCIKCLDRESEPNKFWCIVCEMGRFNPNQSKLVLFNSDVSTNVYHNTIREQQDYLHQYNVSVLFGNNSVPLVDLVKAYKQLYNI